MIRFRPRSMLTLVATGYIVVAIPLMVAIPIAYQNVGELTERSRALVADTAALVRLGATLGDQLNALDRAARQYRVLGDPGGLDVVTKRAGMVTDTVDALGAYSQAVQMVPLIHIKQTVDRLPQRLAGDPDDARAAVAALDGLDLHRRAITREIDVYVESEVEGVNTLADNVRRQLALPTVALIPASLALALIFTYLTVRPVRQFSVAIRRLGRGDFDRPVRVDGPHELTELGRQLDWMRQQLRAMDEEKDRFLAHMSHELKTPLASFMEGLALLEDGTVGTVNDRQREVLDILSVSAEQLRRLIENLLKFHAWANASQAPAFEPINLRELVDTVLTGHQLTARAGQVHVRNAVADITVRGHADSLQLAISNLVSNAIKYSPAGASITVAGDTDEQSWWLSVEDAGDGVAPDEVERIFQPFFQGRRAGRGPLSGSGIGLAVVAGCMDRHGGRVDVDSAATGGAVFTLRAPSNGQ